MTATSAIQARPAKSSGRGRRAARDRAPIHSGHSGSVAASRSAAHAGNASVAGCPGFGIRAREPERSRSPEPIHSGMNHSARDRDRARHQQRRGPAAAAATARARRRAGTATPPPAAARSRRRRRAPPAGGPPATPGCRPAPARSSSPARRPPRCSRSGRRVNATPTAATTPAAAPAEVAPEPEAETTATTIPARATITHASGAAPPSGASSAQTATVQRLERRHLLGAERAVGDLAPPQQPRPRVVDGAGAIEQRRQRGDGERARR